MINFRQKQIATITVNKLNAYIGANVCYMFKNTILGILGNNEKDNQKLTHGVKHNQGCKIG